MEAAEEWKTGSFTQEGGQTKRGRIKGGEERGKKCIFLSVKYNRSEVFFYEYDS